MSARAMRHVIIKLTKRNMRFVNIGEMRCLGMMTYLLIKSKKTLGACARASKREESRTIFFADCAAILRAFVEFCEGA